MIPLLPVNICFIFSVPIGPCDKEFLKDIIDLAKLPREPDKIFNFNSDYLIQMPRICDVVMNWT